MLGRRFQLLLHGLVFCLRDRGILHCLHIVRELVEFCLCVARPGTTGGGMRSTCHKVARYIYENRPIDRSTSGIAIVTETLHITSSFTSITVVNCVRPRSKSSTTSCWAPDQLQGEVGHSGMGKNGVRRQRFSAGVFVNSELGLGSVSFGIHLPWM